MPGSSNFIGEFMILLGVFKAKLAIAAIAFLGVVGAGYYGLRLFITAMHNRVGRGVVAGREVSFAEAIAIVPLVLVILVFAFYPQFGLTKSHGRSPPRWRRPAPLRRAPLRRPRSRRGGFTPTLPRQPGGSR